MAHLLCNYFIIISPPHVSLSRIHEIFCNVAQLLYLYYSVKLARTFNLPFTGSPDLQAQLYPGIFMMPWYLPLHTFNERFLAHWSITSNFEFIFYFYFLFEFHDISFKFIITWILILMFVCDFLFCLCFSSQLYFKRKSCCVQTK